MEREGICRETNVLRMGFSKRKKEKGVKIWRKEGEKEKGREKERKGKKRRCLMHQLDEIVRKIEA